MFFKREIVSMNKCNVPLKKLSIAIVILKRNIVVSKVRIKKTLLTGFRSI